MARHYISPPLGRLPTAFFLTHNSQSIYAIRLVEPDIYIKTLVLSYKTEFSSIFNFCLFLILFLLLHLCHLLCQSLRQFFKTINSPTGAKTCKTFIWKRRVSTEEPLQTNKKQYRRGSLSPKSAFGLQALCARVLTGSQILLQGKVVGYSCCSWTERYRVSRWHTETIGDIHLLGLQAKE